VLRDLTLDVPEGSVFGLIGSNGVGKTTTIKILMNILKADSGEARVLGIESRRLGPTQFEKIGYVSENQQMPGWMTIEYLLAYLKPFYPSWDSAHAEALLQQFRLPRDRKLSQLSRGMWMKTALLSSLVYRPRLLVLDEPFSGLDPVVREDLIESLIDSANETTLFISSHDLADIESFATQLQGEWNK
jgi:ABC-2 type transport system ATP-binding protein